MEEKETTKQPQVEETIMDLLEGFAEVLTERMEFADCGNDDDKAAMFDCTWNFINKVQKAMECLQEMRLQKSK